MLHSVIREIFRFTRRKPPSPPVHGAVAATQYRLDAITDALKANAPDRALDEAKRALVEQPLDPRFWYYAGLAEYLLGNVHAAAESLRQALERDARNFDSHLLLGAIRQEQSMLSEALDQYRRAAAIRPTDAPVHGYMGNMLFMLGRYGDAVSCYEKSLQLDPENAVMQSNLLFAMNNAPHLNRSLVFEAHLRWGQRLEKKWAHARKAHANERSPDRPLRIGYVSADFRSHSVAYFIDPFWSKIDRAHYKTYVYDNFPGAPDEVARRLQRLADAWRRIADLSDDDVARLVREDGIDVLVDVSGHTGGNRLAVFARKPAPVQATWFAYMNTTGLQAIDYRITDEYLSPSGSSEAYYTEALFRIPSCACFSPAPESPPVNALPALKNGFITFASFNSWAKVSPQVIDAWCRILTALPRARLLLVARGGDDTQARARMLDPFARNGIDRERVSVLGTRPLAEFLNMFQDVDIALDPFPYNGGTTSLHTLWMGVPVVTLQGNSETARGGGSILCGMGLKDLVAGNVDEYCAIAAGLARDTGRLGQLRLTLREKMAQSPIMDAGPTTRAMEMAFREMWRNYVRGDRASLSVPPAQRPLQKETSS